MAKTEYVDPEEDHTYYDHDDFEDIWEDTGWLHPSSDFQRRILSVCGRKRFASKADRKRTESIEKGMKPTKSGPPKYPPEYVEGWIQWAIKKNTNRTIIIHRDLVSAIRNPDNLTKYYNKKLKDAQENLPTNDDPDNYRRPSHHR